MNVGFSEDRRAGRGGTGFRACLLTLSLVACLGAASAAHADEVPPTLAVLPFEIEDTSGEVGPSNRHDAMLERTTAITAEQMGASGLFSVVPQAKVLDAIAAVNPGTYLRRCNGCELDIATRAGARYVLIGWMWKVSTLILTLHVDIKDVVTGKTVYSRIFDFRGDNEKAYAHAVRAMVNSVKDAIKARPGDFAAIAGNKTKIAVFDFELEDKSAGGGIIAPDERDKTYLAEATEQAKRLLTDSGRYVLVGTQGAALDEKARKFGIRNCDGCEAAAASKLGGDAAMIGVITRVNRTEHTLLIRVVDARSGAPLSTGFTDLRMGANYAWSRSVKWLMTRRVLANTAAN